MIGTGQTRGVLLALALAAALAAQQPGPRGREVDAVAAVVNGQAITTSQVEQAAWYARLSAALGHAPLGRPSPLTTNERAQALQHLIGAVLVAAQGQAPAVGSQMGEQWAHLAAEAGGEANLERWCAAYHLSAPEVRGIMRRQLELLAVVDSRLAAQATVTAADVAQYYRRGFLPAARRRGIAPPLLARVAPQIRAILIERRLLALQTAWLAQLRAQAQVRILRP